MTKRDGTQKQRVLSALAGAYPGGLSALELLDTCGVYRAAAVVFDLRAEGWLIATEEHPGRTAVYRLTQLHQATRYIQPRLGL